MRCLCCGKTITENASTREKEWCWHKKCVKKFFHTDELPVLDITKEQLEILADETVNEGLTVPGVQKKLSLHLSTDMQSRLTIVDYPTGYILKPQTEDFENMPEYEDLAMRLIEIMGIQTVPHALIKLDHEYAYITKRAVLFQFVSLILLFLLVRSKDDYGWYAALTVISSGGSAVLNLIYSRKLVNWRQKSVMEYKKHLKPILLIFGTSVASSIYMTMDTTMLGAMNGDTATGIYTAAVKINTVISTLIGTISSTILPRVSYYIGNGLKEEYKKLMKASMDVLMMIAMPVSIGMMCTSDILILIFSGAEFLPGSLAAKILSAKVVVGAVNRVLAYQICIPYKRDKEVLISTSGGAVFNLIANALLIPIWGVNGAAIATLFSEIVVVLILTMYTYKYFPVRLLYARGPVYFAASIWFFLCRYLMNQLFDNSILVLGSTVVICALGYFAILVIIKDPYLKEFMRGFIERIKKLTGKQEV